MELWEGLILIGVVVGFIVFMYVAMKGWEDSDDGYF